MGSLPCGEESARPRLSARRRCDASDRATREDRVPKVHDRYRARRRRARAARCREHDQPRPPPTPTRWMSGPYNFFRAPRHDRATLLRPGRPAVLAAAVFDLPGVIPRPSAVEICPPITVSVTRAGRVSRECGPHRSPRAVAGRARPNRALMLHGQQANARTAQMAESVRPARPDITMYQPSTPCAPPSASSPIIFQP